MMQTADTPMLRQFKSVKESHQDAIVFFRLGDFYEMFLDDAKIASKELDLTLTGRGKDENRIPMCGVPYHAADNYIYKLVNKGYKVAICEQIEEATASKEITKRDVIKIVTPGTLQGNGALDEKSNNFLAACNPIKDNCFAFSYLDISTGEFRLTLFNSFREVESALLRLEAKELIMPDGKEIPSTSDQYLVNHSFFLSDAQAEKKLMSFFNLSQLSSLGIQDLSQAFSTAWALIDYATHTQKRELDHILSLKPLPSNRIRLDAKTIYHLELLKSTNKDQQKGSLFWILDQTKTPMGARLLKQLIKEPFYNETIINHRLDATEALLNNVLIREDIQEHLSQIGDAERILSRIMCLYNNPRDLQALGAGLSHIQSLVEHLEKISSPYLTKCKDILTTHTQENGAIHNVINLVQKALNDELPTHLRDGQVIKPGYSEELDALTASFASIKTWILQLEESEREKTGIKSLKVGFNKVFGYYLEVPKSQQDHVPETYIRKQTLTNAERYITPELKEKETILLNGEEQQSKLEQQIYGELIQLLKNNVQGLQAAFQVIADLDVLASLATIAQTQTYTRPKFVAQDAQTLYLKDARHPVLEKQQGHQFIPNTITMSKDQARFSLITGPNMAGKSTLMRQVALSVIMAQIGSFVPASEAKLSLVDNIYTRIGATDDLYAGQSTFMVEMIETSAILNTATQNSLIILDEVGRGTATFDGMSIAWAITEHIINQCKSRTLFATHYHEITILEEQFPSLANHSMEIKEDDGKLIFTYRYIPGAADRSYGIHVAQLAGLPDSVITKATKLLEQFEQSNAKAQTKKVAKNQLSLFD